MVAFLIKPIRSCCSSTLMCETLQQDLIGFLIALLDFI
jgi:hypothetical protein